MGVVSEVKYAGLDQPDDGTVYQPLPPGARARNVVLRTAIEPRTLVPALQQIMRGLDATVPLSSVLTVDELVARSLQTPRSLSWLVGGFAGVALLLAIVGIYGVMSYYVQQHSKDIGIRMALGGSSSEVLRLIVGQGMSVVASGVAVGLLGAIAATRLMTSLLFGVGAVDASPSSPWLP